MVQASTTTTPGLIKHDKKHRLKQRFEVKHKLGQGSYGKVQLATNKETGQEVAIKTIKKSKIQSEQDLVRIRREIQIMSSIQHPHIIHIYEVFENKEKIVLVMQYASGGELYEYVSDRKVLSDNEARRLFRQIATAVYYCHKNKVCHRDLKLENILLDHNGNAKIADFGLSNVFDEKHFLNTFCGSPLYASPEIVKGIPYHGAEVDCWSLGVLLYTLVYGAMPFDGSHFKRLVKQISESSYFEPKQKSEASGLIRRLLAVDPTKRATIIDICTDWWVNKGYEHSLLQVAEDLANLTPVRLDVLLALAPISPPVEGGAGQHPLADREVDLPGDDKTKRSKSKSSRSDEALYPPSKANADYPADTSELSTDIPTYNEEEEEELADGSEIVDDGDEFLPSAVAAALQDECQEPVTSSNDVAGAQSLPVPGTSGENSSEPSKPTKRVAGSSFDSNSVSRVSSHVMKRKKPKKGSEEVIVTESEDRQVSSSGYMSDGTSVTGGTFPPSQIIIDDSSQNLVTADDGSVTTAQDEGERVEDDTAMPNKTSKVPYDSLPDENASISSQISSLPETGRDTRNSTSKGGPSISGTTTSKTQSSASIETLTAQEAQSECDVTSSSSTLIDDQRKLSRQSTSRSSVKSKSKSASPKRPIPSKISSSFTSTSTSSSSTIVSGKQPPTVSSSSSSSRSVPEKPTRSGVKIAQKSAKESPPKSVVKGKVEDQVKTSTSTMPTSTSTSPSTSTVTTTATSSTLKESPSTSAPGSEASESVPTTPDADKTKPWLERRASVDRKVGKISYPKFLENKSTPEKKPVPTYGKISTAKKMFETRRSSVDKDKERVIPMVKVSDAKRAFERRASMPATQAPLWKNAGERKASLIQQSSLDETSTIVNQSPLSKDKSVSLENNKQSTVRTRKSPSSPVKSRSPNKSPVKTVTSKPSIDTKSISESKQTETIKDHPKPKVKSTSSIVINSGTKKVGTSVQSNQESKSTETETKSFDVKSSESGSIAGKGENESVSRVIESPSIQDPNEERKSLAKDVIKKQIAKAKLQELRQSSIESNLSVSSDQHGTKLSCQTGSSEELTKPKSYVKAPQPFIKDEIKPKPVRSVAEIKLSSKPKLGLDIKAAHQDQQKLTQKQQSDEIEEVTPTNIIEPPSTAGTTQNQESNPGTPSTVTTTLSKAAPITRSYKKVTFTKDGACITETGKIISEESADGSFSRIEKKSKVTHYPVGSGSEASAARSESSEETKTIKNLGGSVKSGGDSFDKSHNGSLSPPPITPSISGVRRSESASSSGSTDIFDDIFDTWSGDPVFGNISGRMRSMLSSSRSPFTSLWGTSRNKRAKKKSRAESAERKPTLASGSGWRRTGHGTDQEFSDTDTDTETSMGFGSAGTGGGLWKFLGSTPSSTNLMDRHRSLLSKHFGSDDFFSDAEPFGSSFRRSLSRDRGSTSFGTARNSSAAGTPTMRMVINPLRTPRSSVNRMTSTPTKQDSLDSNESGGSNTQQHVSFSSQPFTGRPYSRTISRESQRQREGVGETGEKSNPGGGGNSFDLDDGSSSGPASRRRVEQWLDMSRDDEEIGSNHPISMYTTIRPRPINRYGRSVSSRFGFDLGSVDSPRDNFQGPSGGSNLSFNTTQEIQIGSPSTTNTSSKPRAEVIIPVGRVSSPSVGAGTSLHGKPTITMKLSLGGGSEPRELRTFMSSGSGGGLGGGGSSSGIIEAPSSADSFGGDWSSPILLPESSSLLDQLRTHGYRNLVTQRLSGLSGPSGVGGEGATRYDNRDNSCVSTTSTTTTPTTNTTVNLPPQQMKRGKSLTGDSSSIRNQNENLIVKNGQSYIAWSNPDNGQSRTIIESTNNNSMPNKLMDHPATNPNSDNSVNQDNERKLISSNRIVRVVEQPVDDLSVGVNCSNRNRTNRIEINYQDKSNYENIKFIDDGEGNGDDDVGSTTNQTKGIGKLIKDDDIDKSINEETNRKINCDLKSGINRKEKATINIPIQRIFSNGNGNQVTSYFSSSITKVAASLPPKPKPFNPKHEPDENSFLEDNQTNHQPHHHHHHPNLNRNQVPSFHLHQQQSRSSGEGEFKPLTPTTTSNRESIQTQRKQEQEQVQHNQPHRKQQSNDIKTCNNNHLTSKDANDDTINRKNVNNIDDNSHRSLNNPNTTPNAPFNDPHHKETLQERILRKSYYSRFNHPLERRASSVRRRTSMIENSDRLMDFSLFDNLSRHHHPSSTPVTSATATTSSHQSPFDNHHLKPPLYLTNDQFIERVQIRAQQLIEEARERHSRINSQLMSSIRPTALDLNDDPIGHYHFHNHSSPFSSHLSSHSTSSHRSREPSPSTFLRRTSSFSGPDELYLNNKSRRPSSSSTTTPTTSTTNRSSVGTLFNGSNKSISNRSSANSSKSPRTYSTRLTNGHSQELDDDEDDDYDYKATRSNGDIDDDYLGDDLTTRAQVVSEALQKLKERALREN